MNHIDIQKTKKNALVEVKHKRQSDKYKLMNSYYHYTLFILIFQILFSYIIKGNEKVVIKLKIYSNIKN